LSRFRDGVEHRQAEMRRAALARRDAADHLGAVGDRCFGMEGAVLAGEALADDLGVLVDQDGHRLTSLHGVDDLLRGIVEIVGGQTLRPDSRMIFLPSSTLVPSRRTTSGT
jgi:hypothetical protein